jgi:hypothetical protein
MREAVVGPVVGRAAVVAELDEAGAACGDRPRGWSGPR